MEAAIVAEQNKEDEAQEAEKQAEIEEQGIAWEKIELEI